MKEFADEKIIRYAKMALLFGLAYSSTLIFEANVVIIFMLFYIAFAKAK
jgi:hypothetical protein|tara:strand:- start:42 stop:188 length:147 start_codon:yes stop_codon:yes gene_type:complete